MIDFFVYIEKINLEKRLVLMINVIKQEIDMEEYLRKILDIICKFLHTTHIFINDFIHKVDI